MFMFVTTLVFIFTVKDSYASVTILEKTYFVDLEGKNYIAIIFLKLTLSIKLIQFKNIIIIMENIESS